MSGKKGMVHYSEEIKEQIRNEHKEGASIKELSRRNGISRWSIHAYVASECRSDANAQ